MKRAGHFLVILLFLAPAVHAAGVSKQQLLDLQEAGVDVDLVVDLVHAECIDFHLDADTLLELAPVIDKRVLQAAFDCREGQASRLEAEETGPGPLATVDEPTPVDAHTPADELTPANEPTPADESTPFNEPTRAAEVTPLPASTPGAWDGTSRLSRELQAVSNNSTGHLSLYSDHLVWSRKKGDPARDRVVSFDEVLRFEPLASHRRGHPDRDRRGGLFVRIADGRGMWFDPLARPGDRKGEFYSPEDANELAGEMNALLAAFRSAQGPRIDTAGAPLAVPVRAGKPGTFHYDGEMIEFVPDQAGAERHAFRLMASRVTEIRINGWGEASLRFDRDSPLGVDERADLETRNGWILLYDWEGKGIIRAFEQRGVEPLFVR